MNTCTFACVNKEQHGLSIGIRSPKVNQERILVLLLKRKKKSSPPPQMPSACSTKQMYLPQPKTHSRELEGRFQGKVSILWYFRKFLWTWGFFPLKAHLELSLCCAFQYLHIHKSFSRAVEGLSLVLYILI